MTDEEMIDMAHTIFLRMAVRGGFDSYTGTRLHEWLRIYESRPIKHALDVCRECAGSGNCEYEEGVLPCVGCNGTGKQHQRVEQTCPTCGSKLVKGKCLNLNCVAFV